MFCYRDNERDDADEYGRTRRQVFELYVQILLEQATRGIFL